MTMHPGRILVLNGCSSSGKTTLAQQLQRCQPQAQFLHVQLDAFRAMEPPDYFGPQHRSQAAIRTEALCRAIHATAISYARHGQNVIMDHVLSPVAWTYLLQDLAPHDVLLVKVSCTLELAQQRERGRGDRAAGLARSQWPAMHTDGPYDHTVDTSALAPQQVAEGLWHWYAQGPKGGAMAARAAAAAAGEGSALRPAG